jgi:hypothetical protein
LVTLSLTERGRNQRERSQKKRTSEQVDTNHGISPEMKCTLARGFIELSFAHLHRRFGFAAPLLRGIKSFVRLDLAKGFC